MKSLAEIFNETGKTDKNTIHTYGPVYEWLLAPYRDKQVNLLEIGVSQHGAGCLLGFAEFLPKAVIWGADIDLDGCCKAVKEHPRIALVKVDAYDPKDVWYERKFSVIVDDAVHLMYQQIKLMFQMMPYLEPDGIYCIEDCITEQWLPILPKLHEKGFQHTLIDMSTKQQPDNTIIVWRKTT